LNKILHFEKSSNYYPNNRIHIKIFEFPQNITFPQNIPPLMVEGFWGRTLGLETSFKHLGCEIIETLGHKRFGEKNRN